MRGGGNLGEARAQQIERRAVEILEHARFSGAPLIDGIERGRIVGEEHDAGENRGRRGEQTYAGFRDHSESAFRPDEQVHPIHAGAEKIAGGVLGDGGEGNRTGIEIEGLTAGDVEPSAIGEHHVQRLHPTARGAEFETAAGIGRDGAAEEGGVLRGVRRIELAGSLRRGLQIAQRDAGAGDGVSVVNFEAIEFLDGEHPPALRNASAGNSSAASGDGDRDAGGGSFAQCRRHAGFIRGHSQTVGVAVESGGVFQIASGYTSRITGMISGRCDVSFTI